MVLFSILGKKYIGTDRLTFPKTDTQLYIRQAKHGTFWHSFLKLPPAFAENN